MWRLNRSLLDHYPLLLEEKAVDWGSKPFQSLDAWFSYGGFIKLVKEEWLNLGDLPLNDKLKALTDPISKWN